MPDVPTIVPTGAGRVRGVREHGMTAWRGIPYAAAPVGELRLSAPQPPVPWRGVRDAAEYGPVPPQPRNAAAAGAGIRTPMAEDCLTISVLRRTAGDLPKPVMVFIYGGAFGIGSAGATSYTGEHLVARGDVLFVGFNYRLGALGWLDFSAYSTPDHPIDSNPGLRDQIAALEWVQRNIAAFGGDPDNVTLFGESAGGTSVATLMTVPSARGLFSRAIVESSVLGAVYTAERAQGWAAQFVESIGASPETAADALRAATEDELVAATSKLDRRISIDQPGARVLAPVIDGELLPAHPLDVFRDGLAHPIPLIIGTNADEGSLFQLVVRQLHATTKTVDRLFELTAPDARSSVLGAYPRYPKRNSISSLVTDLMFWQPSLTIASGHARIAPTWMYRFDFATRLFRLSGLGATHAVELDFVFGRPDSVGQRIGRLLGGGRAARAITARMHQRWLRFARTGTVDAAWPRYDPDVRRTLVVDAVDRVEADPRVEVRRALEPWESYR
jgi:para-nitrobenzyl esterase